MKHWLEESIFYEIYPQSFCDSNCDGIGDIPGIIEKLDYIKELGCNALWLNPCYLSPFGDAGYDVADYCRVAPRYGTNDDLVRLFEEAHKRDMHVILDLVPGHTSVEHPWFKESCKAEPNQYWGRYIWSNSVWVDVADYDGIAGSLRGISSRDGSVAVNFFSNQPALNYGFAHPTEPWQSAVDSPEALGTRQAMKDAMTFWLSRGCDGFRVDMAGSLVKNDPGSKETIRLWQDIRAFLDQTYPDAVMISEWGEPDKSLMGGFHMDFLLQFGTSHYMDLFRCDHPYFSREGKGDASSFVETYKRNYQLTNQKGMMCIPSGNHDTTRIRNYLDCNELKLVYAFLLSMPGAPFLYYGDEIGMRYLKLTSVEGGYDRTGSRTPMQWNKEKNYGFSAAPAERLYTPQDPAEDAPVVSEQMEDPNSLWHEIQKLTKIRRAFPALCASGDIRFVYCEPEKYPLVYLRSADNQKILVALNPSAEGVSCPCPYEMKERIYTLGGDLRIENGILYIPGESAGFASVR
ncbi:MAG: alpha-amylase family glycosyl hydrolase [Lachnospiraceae bacterium]|nr:alpha-amylase family glycosyl hydrolase [Lachnospiraceae bacterium]